ncbi:MAG TPA: hypothetical protein VFV86_10870, partial [Nitrososphaeraceae archaeon]|nr:hypothetical protein [Nitrososphaeraceae archaeon]
MKTCKICGKNNSRKLSEFCSIKCSNKNQYNKNRNKIIKKAHQWNIDNKDKRNKRDNLSAKSTYRLIIDRCNNINNKSYNNYGGKGIKCFLSFDEFIEIYKENNCSICGCKLDNN